MQAKKNTNPKKEAIRWKPRHYATKKDKNINDDTNTE